MSKRRETGWFTGLIRRTDELDEVSVTGAVNEALRFVCRKAVLIVDNHVCYCTIFEHGIPYRALLPQGVKNVIIAGRSISCDKRFRALCV